VGCQYSVATHSPSSIKKYIIDTLTVTLEVNFLLIKLSFIVVGKKVQSLLIWLVGFCSQRFDFLLPVTFNLVKEKILGTITVPQFSCVRFVHFVTVNYFALPCIQVLITVTNKEISTRTLGLGLLLAFVIPKSL
jgi:hypothetical protein